MKKYLLLITVLFISLLSCTNPGKLKNNINDNERSLLIEKSKWLTGNWQLKSAKGILTETWHQLDDSTMIGQSYFMAGGDTLSLENIRLEQRKGKLTYIPLVRDQNNGQVVYFTLTNITDSTMVFENPEHDFPQKISYSLRANDSLVAEVSALKEGIVKLQSFRMGKVTN